MVQLRNVEQRMNTQERALFTQHERADVSGQNVQRWPMKEVSIICMCILSRDQTAKAAITRLRYICVYR